MWKGLWSSGGDFEIIGSGERKFPLYNRKQREGPHSAVYGEENGTSA